MPASTLQESIFTAFQHPKLEPLRMPNCAGDDTLPSWFEVSSLVQASIGAASSAIARYVELLSNQTVDVTLNSRLANLWFGMTLQPDGWSIPPAWDSIAGDYQAKDGWIRLHTNVPHHKQAALAVLQCSESRADVEQVVKNWTIESLEDAVVTAGGVAAAMRSIEQWQHHEQGKAVSSEPLVDWTYHDVGKQPALPADAQAPLQGIKVLDLTRVLAGPVATRFLAAFGAQVLRIDPPEWDEPGLIPEVTPGKHCAELNLKSVAGLQQLKSLIAGADILIHGYRADALETLGLTQQARRELNPRLIDISLNAYGWTGPWKNRRGFDSLVQMSSGIADYGMAKAHAEKPVPLPVQALDHATGYLLATSAIQALTLRSLYGITASARCSLARTAMLLLDLPRHTMSSNSLPLRAEDFSSDIENTDWGNARRVRFPLQFSTFTPRWAFGAKTLRSAPPEWTS